jgi:hypothetical protein
MIKMNHPNWHDREIEIESFETSLSANVVITATDGKKYGISVNLESIPKDENDLKNQVEKQLAEFSVNS